MYASPSRTSELSILGIWKLKSLESSTPNLVPVPQQATTRFLPKEDALQYINDSVYADGHTRHAECIFRLDGQPYALTGSLLGDTWIARQIDADTYEATITRNEQISARASATISSDGRTMTTRWEIVPATGPTITYVSLAERQER